MMVLVEPTKSGRWKWHGVLICTEHAQQPSILEEFPQLAPHDILWERVVASCGHFKVPRPAA
jgi:hypothetical protein